MALWAKLGGGETCSILRDSHAPVRNDSEVLLTLCVEFGRCQGRIVWRGKTVVFEQCSKPSMLEGSAVTAHRLRVNSRKEGVVYFGRAGLGRKRLEFGFASTTMHVNFHGREAA